MPTLAWAWPEDEGARSSSHGHALRGHATRRICRPPLGRHPDRRAEGPEWRDPFEQRFHKAPGARPQHALQWGVNVDLSAKRSTPHRNCISGVASRR